VALAALAMRLERFTPQPVVIHDGALVDLRREEWRKEAKLSETEAPDLGVEVVMDGLRTIYSSVHDHHAFVGKVLDLRPINPQPGIEGWVIELECLPDNLETGYRLPLYVFPPALEPGYLPARGDLVQGIAWLQGTWKGSASADDAALWKKAGGD
jgi:hypothetical protein